MTRLNAKAWNTNRLGGAHRFMALVAAVALLLQSFAVQTHIHSASDEIGGVFRTAGHTAAPGQSPLDKAAGCPLCQAIVHAGVFVAPSVPLVYLPFSWVGVARPVFAVPSEPAGVVHDWRSRAPPRG